jgi:hypothetical protein
MTISQHAKTFAGLPVRPYDPDKKKKSQQPCVYRLGGLEYGEEKQAFPELLDRFLDEHGGPGLTALVIGAWDYEQMLEGGGGASEVIEALVANRKRLPELKALFFGDITYEECEMSWIAHGDVSPLLPAFAKLEEFRIRGTTGLTFGKLKHNNLRSFAVESGGLAEELLREVTDAKLPELEHLELWLGTEGYGGIGRTEPLAQLLSGKLFPKLRSLALRNCAIADDVARAVAASHLVERLAVLDLSLGNLGDVGAEALLNCQAVQKLKKLDLHHHYTTPPFIKQLKELPCEVDFSEASEPDRYTIGDTSYEDRYIVVSE